MPNNKEDQHQGRRTLDHIIRFTSSVGEDAHFRGTFSGSKNIVVRGQVTGDSKINGVVAISDKGVWRGKITAGVIVVAGKVVGEIVAEEKLEILATGHIKGNISGPCIAIAIGAIHEGNICMREGSDITEFKEKRTSRLILDPD